MSASSRRARVVLALVGAVVLTPMTAASSLAATPAHAAPTAVTASVSMPAPSLVGELAVGETLQAQPDPTVAGPPTYQWFADGEPIEGATASTLRLGAAQANRVVNVEVSSAEDTIGSARSTNTLRVATATRPGITGITRTGSILIANVGSWTPGVQLQAQWLANGQPIAGATDRTVRLTRAQSGAAISVRITGTAAGYPTLSRVSHATPRRVMDWTTPTVSGTAAVGNTLTAQPGTWTSGTTLSYQWLADGSALSGATGPTLTLGTAHRDRAISVRVTGSKAGHTTTSATSVRTGRVMTAPTPTISGVAVVGSTLTASTGTWTTSTTRTLQWYADGAAISGATASTLVLAAAHRDKAITVQVTGKRSGWTTVTRASKATLRVQNAPTPTISGTAQVTRTLTAVPGTAWSSGTSFSYQWYASGAAISGATGATLKLGTAHVGKTISVRVTGTKSGYPSVARTSRATAAVSYPLATSPIGDGNCPSWAPIKGNANSGIYHVPGGRYYNVTKAEECFRTEAAAVAAGYRKSKL